MQSGKIRDFNRFYARALGVFDRTYLNADYNVTEIRVLGEIAREPGITAARIIGLLRVNKGYLSRLLGRLERDGLIRRVKSVSDGRSRGLYLTDAGSRLSAQMDGREDERIQSWVAALSDEDRERIVDAMGVIQALLDPERADGARHAHLRRGDAGDCDRAMALIDQAKRFLREQRIDQWQTGYPDRACIEGDLKAGKGYFLEIGGVGTAGYLCIDFEGEPAYDRLNGAWLTGENQNYAVVHRLALDSGIRGKGLGAEAFRLAEDFAREHGVKSMRVDTDADNQIMRHLLDKLGYRYCGTIRFDNSDKIAFEKIL